MTRRTFANAQDAWIWTMRQLMARKNGGAIVDDAAPFEPDEIVRAVDALYRRRRIDLVHARILRIWGERQVAPNPDVQSERCDWRLWREAIDRLERPLRVKGIIA